MTSAKQVSVTFTYCILIVVFVGLVHGQPFQNVALRWTDLHLQLIRSSATVGPVSLAASRVQSAARSFVLVQTCMYDTWAAYDNKASPVNTNNGIGRKTGSQQDIEKAVSFAAYRGLSYVFGELTPVFQQTIDTFFAGLGYDKNDNSTDTRFHNAAAIGNVACEHVLRGRDEDGSNAKGDHPMSDGTPYSDFTNYLPANDPFPQIGKTDCAAVRNVDKWQPARVRTPTGSRVQVLVDAHYAHTYKQSIMFPVDDILQNFPPPPRNGTASQPIWDANVEDVVYKSSQLNDYHKAVALYWNNRPDGPLGYMVRLALDSAVVQGLDLEMSIKLMFAIAHTLESYQHFVNDGKRFFDSARPTTVVQCSKAGQTITAWKGPYQGVGQIDGSNWTAYFPDTVVQVPTAEYPCGHCTGGGMFSRLFQLFYGSDTYHGYSYTWPAGSFPAEKKILQGEPGHIAGLTDVPNSGPNTQGYAPATDVTLNWNTWTEAGLQIGLSRVYLGVHFNHSWMLSYEAGQRITERVWPKILSMFFGVKV